MVSLTKQPLYITLDIMEELKSDTWNHACHLKKMPLLNFILAYYIWIKGTREFTLPKTY